MTLTIAPVNASDLDLFAAALAAHHNTDEMAKFGVEYDIEMGKKYARIVKRDTHCGVRLEHTGSAYAFVELATGLIYKPDGWKRPAKHARGSFHADDRGMSCCGRYGVAYMRG